MNIPPHLKNIFNDKTLTMNQKYVSFLAYSDPKDIPHNNNEDFVDVGNKIKSLVKDNTLKINGFDQDFKIQTEILSTIQ